MIAIMRKLFVNTLVLIFLNSVYSQNEIGGIVNQYYSVIDYNNCENFITLSNSSALNVGDRVMIIQMKGASVNESNTSLFGEIINYGCAGCYELNNVLAIDGTIIYLEYYLENDYDYSSYVQLIYVPQYENVSVTQLLEPLPWNGIVGGVLAIEVEQNLTLNANITASAKGFRGGNVSSNFWQSGNCASSGYYYTGTNMVYGAYKGESISNFQDGQLTGRGAIANGGGGGNNLNAGGGGGSLYGFGGLGGNEWSGCTGASVGGRGGYQLSNYQTRLFLGGGGGGGHQNNSQSTNGGRGGGIVYIKANQVITNDFSIISNGESITVQAGIDAAGGGGSGGMVLLDVIDINGNLNISVAGGNGGSVNNGFTGGGSGGQCHGPGGGGGGGIIALTSITTPLNLVGDFSGGNPGLTVNAQSSCLGNSYGALGGSGGSIINNIDIIESDILTSPLIITINSISSSECNANNGSVSINASGGVEAYTYTWIPNVSSSDTAENLSAGEYTVEVTDSIGCTITSNIVVPTIGGGIILIESLTNTSCIGVSDGTASVIVDGGFQPYTYTWSPSGGNTSTALGLASGTYSVLVTDSQGCTDSVEVFIDSPAPISIQETISSTECGANNGSVTINTSGGTGAYTYAWTPNVSSSSSANNLGAGLYSLVVSDENDCSESIDILIPTEGNLDVLIESLTNTSCIGVSDGTASVIVDGGFQPYTYTWSPSGGNTSTALGLASGTYSVLVTDSQGCTDSVEVFIDSPAPISIQETISSTECGANNGSVTINTSGGTGAYTYAWTPNVSSSSSANNLGAGLYSLVVSDENDCSESIDILIPTEGNLDVLIESLTNTSCIGVSDGTASVIVDGSFQPYTYTWSPSGGNTSTASGLASGTYSVLVKDAQGCTGTVEVTISSPEQIEIFGDVIDAECSMSNGSISAMANGGTGSLTFEWSPEGETTSSISELSAGNYTLTVTDDNGCFATQDFLVGATGILAIEVDPVFTTIYEGGSVQLTASGALYYYWDPSESLSCSDCIDPIASPTSTTTYAVYGADSFGCTGIVYVTVYVNHLEADIFIPNVFTPNADESNNHFAVRGFDKYKEFEVLILNRWGNVVFSSDDPEFSWNGEDQTGSKVSDGVYFYKITGINSFDGKEKEFHGFIHLIR